MAQPNQLKEAYETINQLMREEKWADAHRACLELLRFDPENIKIIRLKNKIENNVKRINKKAIQTDIQNLKPLWKTGDYQQILVNLKQLEPYITDNPSIKTLIEKATKKYQEQLRGDQEVGYKGENTRIEALINENKYQEALLGAERLRVMGIHDSELKKLISRIRNKWIEQEMKENQTLLSSTKYEDILLFYQRILKIDPGSSKLKNLIEQTKKTYQVFKVEEKKEFIYKSLEEIKTLYQIKKYEKASQACAEILEIDPQNKSALKFQKLAANKTQKIIDDEVISQIINNQKNLKIEYKANKKSFDRIF